MSKHPIKASHEQEISTYQQVMNKAIAHALELPGLKAFPQHMHRLTAIIMIWLAMRASSDPTPKPVAISEP